MYRYYSTLRSVEIGTFPKPEDNRPMEIRNFETRIEVENGAFKAWGYVDYLKPLTVEQIREYELRKSWDY